MAKDENHIPEGDYEYIPLIGPPEVWTTYDLGVSAALMSVGFELVSVNKDNPHKSLFSFRWTEMIETVVDLYWCDKLEVKARSFFDNIKALKNRLYSE